MLIQAKFLVEEPAQTEYHKPRRHASKTIYHSWSPEMMYAAILMRKKHHAIAERQLNL